MNIIISARKFNVRDSLREKIEKKLLKFDKFFDREATAKVVMSMEKDRHIMEITLEHASIVFRVQQVSDDMQTAFDLCVDNLERKIRKHKSKLEKRLRDGAFEYQVHEEPAAEYDVIKTKKFTVKPMDIEEAILQMEMLGHNFFVFRDVDSEDVNVVYRRTAGGYGHIVPK